MARTSHFESWLDGLIAMGWDTLPDHDDNRSVYPKGTRFLMGNGNIAVVTDNFIVPAKIRSAGGLESSRGNRSWPFVVMDKDLRRVSGATVTDFFVQDIVRGRILCLQEEEALDRVFCADFEEIMA